MMSHRTRRPAFWMRLWSLLLLGGLGALVGPSFAAETFGVYRSTDQGRTWTQVGTGLPPDVRIEAVSEVQGKWFAGTEQGLWISGDEGRTWRRPERGVPERLKVYAVVGVGNRVLAASSEGVWEAPRQGEHWSQLEAPWSHRRVLSLAVVLGRVYAGTDGHGIHLLLPGSRQWEDLSAGLPPGVQTQVFEFAEAGGQLFAALYSRGVYRFDSAQRRWVEAGREQPLRLVASGSVLFAGRNPGGVAVSRDGGSHWQDANVGLPDRAPTWCLGRAGSAVLIGTSGPSGLLRTDDEGQRWVPSDQGIPIGGEAVALGEGSSSVLAVVIRGQRAAIPSAVLPGLPVF